LCYPRRQPHRQPLLTHIPCATPNPLFKHPDATIATYKRKIDKYLKHASETLAKTPEKHLKTTANICNIQMHTNATYKRKQINT
jgi:hypothetical protein